MSESLYAAPLFRFEVSFYQDGPAGGEPLSRPLCEGSFTEITGLEATMEPKVIKCGGANYGPFQRVGPVSFGTVVLKRGVTTTRDLWNWFAKVTQQGKSAVRLKVVIQAKDPVEPASPSGAGGAGAPGTPPPTRVQVELRRVLPVKFKMADFSAKTTEISIEELHLTHEGMSIS